ncbi:hypothetical protein L218DRAFT_886229 [Marasmius fiardii PR-910]|nr:hypothetical protein L218DRAFT_886229 [Marasmius fiardii PR-910]
MALIELHRLHMSIVKGWGKSVVPRSDGVFKSGRTFTSSNGQKYTWKRQTRTAKLTDKSDNTLAVFQERSIDVTTKEQEPSLAKLSITPDAVGLAHEIVGTFIYVEPAG